ncbi:hypothetical protein TYRP_020999 [Tyrophagus putrescentiae]|nr:hypothetical protein TYRP_020999 [Tyrophagus putrescentiae]
MFIRLKLRLIHRELPVLPTEGHYPGDHLVDLLLRLLAAPPLAAISVYLPLSAPSDGGLCLCPVEANEEEGEEDGGRLEGEQQPIRGEGGQLNFKERKDMRGNGVNKDHAGAEEDLWKLK